jgi:hypothetical protein
LLFYIWILLATVRTGGNVIPLGFMLFCEWMQMITREGLLDWKVMVSLASWGSGLGFDFYGGEQFIAEEGHFLLIECAHQLLNFMESGLLLLPK